MSSSGKQLVFFFNRKSSIRHLVRRNIGSGRRTIRDMVDNFCKSNYHITQILLAIHKEKGGLHHQMSKFKFTILAKNNILINDNGASRNHGVTRGRPPLGKKMSVTGTRSSGTLLLPNHQS